MVKQAKCNDLLIKYGNNLFDVFKDSNRTIYNLRNKNIYTNKDNRIEFLENLKFSGTENSIFFNTKLIFQNNLFL